MPEKLQVLILCTANYARSQKGERLLRHPAGNRVDVVNAGRDPTSVKLLAIEALQERGIDMSGHVSDLRSQYLYRKFDFAITACYNVAESCPVIPGRAKRIHWSFPFPAAVEGDENARVESFISVGDGAEE